MSKWSGLSRIQLPVVFSAAALAVSVTTLYFNVFREVQSVELSILTTAGNGEDVTLKMVAVNKGNRDAAIVEAKLSVLSHPSRGPSPWVVPSSDDSDNEIDSDFQPTVLKPNGLSLIEVTQRLPGSLLARISKPQKGTLADKLGIHASAAIAVRLTTVDHAGRVYRSTRYIGPAMISDNGSYLILQKPRFGLQLLVQNDETRDDIERISAAQSVTLPKDAEPD